MITNPVLQAALPLLSALEQQHFEAVFVGGCVRDDRIGRPITDVDIATSAKPEDVCRIFPRTIPTGLKHGTVTVLLDGTTYEVTTYRKESAYEAFRRPAEVEFITELTEDLRRRDFTINAMALRGDGKLIDPFGGLQDLQDGIIRCVGDADARFQEDALRMLRGIRFAAQFGESREPIFPRTWEAMLRRRDLLRHVAMERVGVELDKMMMGKRPDYAFDLLIHSGLLQRTKEQLTLPDPAWGDWRALIDSSRVNTGPLTLLSNPNERWAAFGLTRGMDEHHMESWFRALRFAGRRSAQICAVISFHRHWLASVEAAGASDDSRLIDRLWMDQVIRFGRETTQTWLNMVREFEGMNPWGELAERLQILLDQMPAASLKELAVNGNDLMRALRRSPGVWLHTCLQQLLRDAASAVVPNNKQSLLQHAETLVSEEPL
ncbi:CCA tRNA nucleotidyltransferase [Paenibacillus abyssi]|uniref:CCA-adding enzyme n=1 Tax=Paenibacillus abyssi TaxID=1340531 RepID=A0A917CJ27_9BACL|nr:CCA tRNA nucleotidyltransferase [Paenibacillus abyssi]GGF89036.1 CCA-adding enzyme [Paenibacillus abyssi]